MLERYGEKLIGPKRNIDGPGVAVAVDDIVEVAALGEPETLVERCMRAFGVLSVSSGARVVVLAQPFRDQTKRVIPKCVDLDRLPAARRDDPIAHLRIHPGKMVIFFALDKQAVGGINVNVEARPAHVMLNDVDE